MERSPRGSQPEEESDYEPGLALPEDPYSPTDSGAEEDLDERMSAGSLGAAELELWTEAPEQDSGAEEQLPEPEEAMSLSEPEAASEDSEESDEEDEDEPAPKRRRLYGKQSAPAYGPPLYPELLAQLRGLRPAAKKKAARKPFAGERCRGYNGEACVFNPQAPGQPAGTHPKRGEDHCLLCKAEKLQALLPAWRANRVTQALKKLKAADEEIFRKAVDRIKLFTDEATAKDFAARGSAAKRQPRKQRPSTSWADCLARRRVAGQALSRKRRAAYEAAAEKDQRLARRKIFYPEKLLKRAGAEQEAEEKAAVAALGLESRVAFNDAELPAPKDPTAKMVEAWCKQGSWGVCAQCSSLRPRQLQPMDLRRTAKPTVPKSQCSACRSGAYVPQPEDIPEALRGLKPRVVEALRPLDVDTGRFQRAQHGYRIHTAMISFAWAAKSVLEKIEALPKRKDRKKAKKALDYLLSAEDSSYKTFIEEHEAFLRKHGQDAEEKRRKRPLRFIEREGLECCLWPHLYWHRNLCETVARGSHPERRARRRAAADSSSDDEVAAPNEREGPNIEESTMGRVRQCFLRKVLSPVIGYGADYDLLHFVYDLSMWTTVGAKKNIASQFNTPLRLVLKNCSWTPEYWRVKHRAVIDMQRQCGNATLFRTRAPYERTFPYHQAILHEMEALGRPRLHLTGLETLHMAHVLLQLDKGHFYGDKFTADRADRRSENHIFAAEDPALQTAKGHVTRLKFQDGKRKRGTQSYHGRGTVHSHSLDFLDNLEAIHLERKIQATVPDREAEPFMHGVVMDSQRDYKDSKVPVREEPSAFDGKEQKVLLQHTEEDKALRVRAYFPAAMEVTKCHEDVQQGDGNGAVLRYVATYNMKFSGSMDQDWLNNDASDFSVARRVLCCYQPLEPEMWLTLAGQDFPQVNFSGTVVDFMAPTPQTEELPALIQRYEEASWRREDMTLLEFARKSNSEGDIVRYLQEHHKRHCLEQVRRQRGLSEKEFKKERAQLLSNFRRRAKEAKAAGDDPECLTSFLEEEGFSDLTSLEDFANEYQTRGEKLIAAATHSMLNDKYYGQWLALNAPFRRLQDFEAKAPDVVEKVPERYRNFAPCMHYAPDHWGNDAVISEVMELEAHSAAHIETILHKVRAQRHLVQRYLSGELDGAEEVSVSEAEPADGPAAGKLTRSQKRLVREMDKQLENALAALQAGDDAALEACIAAAAKHKMLFASGPPGTGKTFVVHGQIRKWQRKGARALFTLPTGQLASEMRAVHPRIDVDTSHGAYRFHRDLQEAAGVLTQYELSVTDEVSMLTAEQFERIVALWKYAEQLPCIVLMGDFWQLPVVDKDAVRCERSLAWVYHVKTLPFHEQVRCKCPTLQRKLNALRTAVPSKRQLHGILQGHRAWKTNSPDGYDLLETFRKHPNTTVVTCTRAASAHINSLAAKVFFEDRHKRPLGKAAFSYEANQDNFTEAGGLKDGRLQAAPTTIYEGMRIFLTANISKEDDFVNGMSAEIQSFDQRSQCLEVLTRTGKRLAVHIVTHELEDGRRVACFPARLGYACTVPKVQGMTLSHITLWLDRAGCRAAAYVALSRVQRDEDYVIAGAVTTAHFVPAQ